MNVWALLLVAIAFEIAGTLLLKISDGFSNMVMGLASIACYWICFGFLAQVLKSLPVGVTYAVWSGVGIIGVALASFFLFEQKLSPLQILFMLIILIGAMGLNLTTKVSH